MTLAKRILVQVGALLPLLSSVFVVLARERTEFTSAEVLPASAAIALTSFVCIWLGLDNN
jgi:hypothetical protein